MKKWIIGLGGGALLAAALAVVIPWQLGAFTGPPKGCAQLQSWWKAKGQPTVGTLSGDISALNSVSISDWGIGFQDLADDAQNAPVFPWQQIGYGNSPASRFGTSWAIFTQDNLVGGQTQNAEILKQASTELTGMQSDAKACGFSIG